MSVTVYDDRRLPTVFSDMPPPRGSRGGDDDKARKSIAFWGLLSILLFGVAVAFGAVAWWQYTQAASAQHDIDDMKRDLDEARATAQTFAAISPLTRQIAAERAGIIDRLSDRTLSAGKREAGRRAALAHNPPFTDPGGDRDNRTRSQQLGASAFAAENVLKAELAVLQATRADVDRAIREYRDPAPGGGGGCADPRTPGC